MLASIEDLAAVGGVTVDVAASSPEGSRAFRLLELASGLVLSFLSRSGITEGDVDEWEDFRRQALAAIVAEVAAKRLNVAAASNVDPYSLPNTGPQTLKLNRWEQQAIRDLLPGEVSGASMSFETERAHSWLGDPS